MTSFLPSRHLWSRAAKQPGLLKGSCSRYLIRAYIVSYMGTSLPCFNHTKCLLLLCRWERHTLTFWHKRQRMRGQVCVRGRSRFCGRLTSRCPASLVLWRRACMFCTGLGTLRPPSPSWWGRCSTASGLPRRQNQVWDLTSVQVAFAVCF